MQGMGYSFSILPALNKIYQGNDEKYYEAVYRNTEFLIQRLIFQPLLWVCH